MKLSSALQTNRAGVYRFRAGSPGQAQSGLRRVDIATRNARDKLAFLRLTAQALAFPDYFGQNWDAFYDCLADLEQRESHGLLVVFEDLSGLARSAPEEFDAAVDALRDAVDYWNERERCLLVLIGVDDPLLATELEEIDAD
jgi:RNAse (barnase) inhibitor barstar